MRLCALSLCGVLSSACSEEVVDVPPEGPGETSILAEGGMGTIMQGATDEQRETFIRGERMALKQFTTEEGLGPRFNVTFCASCHEKPHAGGSAPRYRDFYLFAEALDDGEFLLGEMGGVSHAYGVKGAPVRPDRDPSYNVVDRRNPIPFFGIGALAELPPDSILANADPNDMDGDGISGRANFDEDGFVGRFGRKSQTSSIEGFIRGPLKNHAGITSDPLTNDEKNRLPVPSGIDLGGVEESRSGLGVARQAQAAAPAVPLLDGDDVPDPELSNSDLFDIVSWAMLLGAPRPDAPTEETTRGREAFAEIGCEKCHVNALEGPRGMVRPWSDLLLHDMGPELADGFKAGLAEGNEYRTQPLWGLAATGPYLHDGRADTVDEAIRMHGGEAEASRIEYVAQPENTRRDILAFLNSLGGADQKSDGLLPPDAPIPEVGEPGAALSSLAAEDHDRFLEGRRLFDMDFTIQMGLGPAFNGDSCRACHFAPVIGGAGPLGVNVMLHGTLDDEGVFTAPESGLILSKLTLPGVPRIEPDSGHNIFEPRQTPTVLGLGLIDSIDEATILALADPEDLDGDGVRGVASVLPDGRVGRLGWKANVPSIREFIRDAMTNEIGVSLPEEEGMTFGAHSDSDAVPDPEISSAQIDDMAFYLANLAPPAPKGEDSEGAELFVEVGCAGCHRPVLEGRDGPVPLYSDLLLHDVAPEGHLGVGDTPRLFRTAPLWGLSDTAPYMHDGLAATVADAIAAHHAEGLASRQAVEGLGESQRAALFKFLELL